MAESAFYRWLLAIRLKTLPAAAAPVILGGALAADSGEVSIAALLVTLVTALLLQILSNLANDLADFESGADGSDRLGPLRVTQAGLISPADMRKACLLVTALTMLGGLYLVYLGGLPILFIGLLCIYFAYRYSVGKNSLSRRGLGELFVILFFGIVPVYGTYFILRGNIDHSCLLPGLAVGLANSAILVVNNLRDISADAISGKLTLAVRFGEKCARAEHALCISGAILSATLHLIVIDKPYALLGLLLTLPPAAFVIREGQQKTGSDLNSTLAKTALFSIFLSLLTALFISL